MEKRVSYNGSKVGYYGCSEPTALVKGKEYVVEAKMQREHQTNYLLKEVPGEFNSLWFDEVSPDEKVYMAVANKVPVIGEVYLCKKLEIIGTTLDFIDWYTSKVKGFYYLGNNIYQVITRNSIYIVNVY